MAWRQRTVAAIVANPRYTGRQVWNRQQTHRRPSDDVVSDVVGVRKLAPSQGWAISDKPAHEALVSEADFVAAQKVTARAQPADGSSRIYLLVGLVRCGECGRNMESQSSHGNPAYRCRHGHTSAHTAGMRQARNLYLRQEVIVGRIFAQLPTLESADASVQERISRLCQEERSTADLAIFLRDHNVTIECRATSVSLGADQETALLTRTQACAPILDERIPRQRKTQTRHQLSPMPRGD